ncbi:hypothetical protein [Embleya sp. NPDC059237]|uniref:hypothetical protein n=1 Tax=Embleya sp. NPDC059237 TaxID=3346784 RepID=UPI00369FD5A5
MTPYTHTLRRLAELLPDHDRRVLAATAALVLGARRARAHRIPLADHLARMDARVAELHATAGALRLARACAPTT